MSNGNDYKVSIFGEFKDRSLESEFLVNSRSGLSKTTAFIALLFGFLFILFLCSDFFEVRSNPSFLIIMFIRMSLVLISIIIFFVAKKIMNPTNLIYLITIFQTIIAISYISILQQYDSLSYLSILGLMVISLAIYLLPNKITISQIISLILSILFFLYPAHKIEALKEYDVYKIVVYQIILLLYCNIKSFLAESYKRKQFAANKEFLALSIIDPLTGIYNRAKFNDAIEKCIDFSDRYGSSLSLILFDVDNFKGINDGYGHLIGDKVTKSIVATISKSIRNTDIFARWGGDEFVILLPNTGIRQASDMAERMRVSIHNTLCDPVKDITCSFGVATYEKNDTAESLLSKADNLLLQAKSRGKDRVMAI